MTQPRALLLPLRPHGNPSLRHAWDRFWRSAGAVPLRTKIMGIVLGLVVVLGVGITWQVRRTLESTLTEELELRGVSIARDLAALGADYVVTNNIFALHELTNEMLTNNPDVRYAFVVDPHGRVLAHTFGSYFPGDLLAVREIHREGRARAEEAPLLLESDEGPLLDIAAPILEGAAGIARVGISQQRIRDTVQIITAELLLATAVVSVVGIVAAYLLTMFLTRPVLDLVRMTRAVGSGDLGQRAVGSGDLGQRAPVAASDEIGELAQALNAMVSRLQATQADLLRRNGDLQALNAVAAAVGSTFELDDVLNRAIDVVLTTTGFDAGGILLFDPDVGGLVYRVQRGLSTSFVDGVAGLRPGEGIAGHVVATGDPLVIDDLATDPRVTRAAVRSEKLHAFVSVPVRAADEVIGALNVGSRQFAAVDDGMRQLLVAVGAEIGVAIQNARLWQELKSKESLRGHLLQRLISAQEEERRRIARELHDETSQALTTVMVGLRLLTQEQPDPRVATRAEELRKVVGSALDAVRDLLLQLRPSMLDDIGLVAALQRYTRDYSEKHDIVVDFQTGGLDGMRLPNELEITAYRIIQEALTNVARHAAAQTVSLLLERRSDRLIGVIEDDGCGFQPAVERFADGERHFGLAGMRERAVLAGGTLIVESEPGTGTAVFVDLPLHLPDTEPNR